MVVGPALFFAPDLSFAGYLAGPKVQGPASTILSTSNAFGAGASLAAGAALDTPLARGARVRSGSRTRGSTGCSDTGSSRRKGFTITHLGTIGQIDPQAGARRMPRAISGEDDPDLANHAGVWALQRACLTRAPPLALQAKRGDGVIAHRRPAKTGGSSAQRPQKRRGSTFDAPCQHLDRHPYLPLWVPSRRPHDIDAGRRVADTPS